MKIAIKTGTQEVTPVEEFTYKGIECFMHKDGNYIVSEKITGKGIFNAQRKKQAKDGAKLLIDKNLDSIKFCTGAHLFKGTALNT